MVDNGNIRYNPSDEAMLKKRLNAMKQETWSHLKRRIDVAAEEAATEIRSHAQERVKSGEMLNSIGVVQMASNDETHRVQVGYVKSAPRYALFQEYGTYGNRVLPSFVPQSTNSVSDGGIAPLQSLAHGYLAALDKMQEGWG